MDILYERIKERRNALGMSQEQLALLLGYTGRSIVSKIEAGKVDLTLSKIQQVASHLGVSVAWLMGLTDPASESERDRQDELFLSAYHSAFSELQQAARRILED